MDLHSKTPSSFSLLLINIYFYNIDKCLFFVLNRCYFFSVLFVDVLCFNHIIKLTKFIKIY